MICRISLLIVAFSTASAGPVWPICFNGVFGGVFVSVGTMGLDSIALPSLRQLGRVEEQGLLLSGHWNKVERIAACPNLAEMMQFVTLRDRPNGQLIGQTMGTLHFPIVANLTIAIESFGEIPNPALGIERARPFGGSLYDSRQVHFLTPLTYHEFVTLSN